VLPLVSDGLLLKAGITERDMKMLSFNICYFLYLLFEGTGFWAFVGSLRSIIFLHFPFEVLILRMLASASFFLCVCSCSIRNSRISECANENCYVEIPHAVESVNK
jgi:hypothetical protein